MFLNIFLPQKQVKSLVFSFQPWSCGSCIVVGLVVVEEEEGIACLTRLYHSWVLGNLLCVVLDQKAYLYKNPLCTQPWLYTMSTEAPEKGVYIIFMIKTFDNESRGVSLIRHVPSSCIFLNTKTTTIKDNDGQCCCFFFILDFLFFLLFWLTILM